jgi:hypothetical protein
VTPHTAAHRPRRRRLLIALGALVVVAGIAIAVVRSITTPAWEQAAIDMAPEFRRLALPADPDSGRRYPDPQPDKWRPALQGISVEATYDDGQTLDSVQHQVEDATRLLGLRPAACVQVDAERGYELTGQRTLDGMLGCSIFDAGKHPVGVLEATQNGAQTTVWISFGEGRGTLAWMHLDPDDLP